MPVAFYLLLAAGLPLVAFVLLLFFGRRFAGLAAPFAWGIFSQHILLGLVGAGGAWFALRKAKAGRASSWIIHAAYWYLGASFVRLRATPPSHCRRLAG